MNTIRARPVCAALWPFSLCSPNPLVLIIRMAGVGVWAVDGPADCDFPSLGARDGQAGNVPYITGEMHRALSQWP